MKQSPNTDFLRISQIIGNSKANKPILAIILINRSKLWVDIKTGKSPIPTKPEKRWAVWRAEDRTILRRTAKIEQEGLKPTPSIRKKPLITDIPLHKVASVDPMNKNNRKKNPNKRWIKGFTGGLFRTTILAVILLGGNDYQITTVIQLYVSHHEAQNPTTLSKHHYS